MVSVQSFLYLIFSTILIIFFVGCKPTRVGHLNVQEYANSDPQFIEAIEKKRILDKEIVRYKKELIQLKRNTKLKIKELKREYSVRKKQIELNIKGLKAQLQPYRDTLINQINAQYQLLRSEKSRLSRLLKMRKDIEGLINKGKVDSEEFEDIKKWKEKMYSLEERIKLIEDNIKQYKARLVRLKSKLYLLRQ